MRAELANLNHCAVPVLRRVVANLCWYYYCVLMMTQIPPAELDEMKALSTLIALAFRYLLLYSSLPTTAALYSNKHYVHIYIDVGRDRKRERQTDREKEEREREREREEKKKKEREGETEKKKKRERQRQRQRRTETDRERGIQHKLVYSRLYL